MISAISPRGELRFRVQEGKMNAGKFIDFLKALLDSVPGKIFLIVDGHPVHKAKKVSEFVKEKADGRLSIFFLPPYSPNLNPDEWVWNNVKNDRIGRSVIMSADDLKTKAIGALRRLQKLPGIVRGFLRDPKLAYILELHKRTASEVYKLIFSLVSSRIQGRAPRARQDLEDARRSVGTVNSAGRRHRLTGGPSRRATEPLRICAQSRRSGPLCGQAQTGRRWYRSG
jgi:transposase